MFGNQHDMPLDAQALRDIVEGTGAHTGEAFFNALVKHLAHALGTKCAWVTEWLADTRRLRALSFWVHDGYYQGVYEYDIANTPCEPVIERQKLIHVPDRLIELYPGDPDLQPLGAVSYMGVALLDTDARLLGHLAVLHDAPMPTDARVTAIFNIFASRAAAELRRLRRDRALREREHQLSRLIASAMDAIVELDGELRIIHMNRAAEEVFGCNATEVTGKALGLFLTNESRGRLLYLTRELERRPEGKQSLWFSDGFEARRVDGVGFPAEATVSRFEMDGRPFYTLILRNINARLEAEDRIRALMLETSDLRAEIDTLQGFDGMVGRSEALHRVLADVEQVAKSNTTVLITGETGTGKELIARAIHQRSLRAGKSLVKVNCAAIPATLQESELFGHEPGAFTGATRRRDGRFKLADGGTIFLDEVGELPLDLQAKLLRVLQEGEFEPVGSSKTLHVDMRVIAATNRNLEQMVKDGTFRHDLLYRLNVFPVHVPPLRERCDDIVLLAEAFARTLARRSGRPVARLTEPDKAKLTRYDWPGNVRELQNVIERAFITSKDGRRLNLERALPEDMAPATAAQGRIATQTRSQDRLLTDAEIRQLEKENIICALTQTHWKISGSGGA
ncbi:MAG TPA: sigma 54-interacting transcriptional regulator, partial [Candidatus Tectomicrobia bacterium]